MIGGDFDVAAWSMPSMGGRVEVSVAAPAVELDPAERAARRVAQRIGAWATRLTRFADSSDLARLNGNPASSVRVRPTLGAVLGWAEQASADSSGVVDVAMLDARLAAEAGTDAQPRRSGHWTVKPANRHSDVARPPGLRFDLDGVAKGWLADRACWLLAGWPGAVVDADGDLALAAADGVEWLIDVTDPRAPDGPPLATLRLGSDGGWRRTAGIATSGTSVHRWHFADGRVTHHLIDARDGRPAQTDVVQATVVAPTAREAEVMAKAAVILGSAAAVDYLARSAAQAALLLLESGRLVVTPGTQSWLA